MEYLRAILIGLGGVAVALAAGMVTWALVRPTTRRRVLHHDVEA